MRFLLEIILCIGAAYGMGWFLSSYQGRVAHGNGNGPRQERHRRGGLALVERLQHPESAVPVRPSRDKTWLS